VAGPQFKLGTAAAALCIASLFGAPAAHAVPLFDVGPGGYIETPTTTQAVSDVQAVSPQAASDVQATAVVDSHLPAWVQVVVASAPLYAADTADDSVIVKLSRHTYLHVLAGGSARMQVQAYDENGDPAQQGWVDPNQVLPSAPGTNWLVSSSATTLWSSSDGTATTVRKLAQFTPLQKLSDAVLGRLQVQVYSSDFTRVVDQGWVDASATGPALPPQMRVPAPTDKPVGLRSVNTTSQQQAFLDSAAQAARDSQAQTGVPASVTVAQAILESSWGQSTLAQSANNYFGMKAMGTLGDAGVIYLPTTEYDGSGQAYQTVSAFRAYKSLADSMADHARLLETSSRYAPAMKVANDPKLFASLIAQEGYSTDPAYADKLVALMDRYNLYQLDA
jgi:flagellum-specific peptidoglycan hydrolase FlgJ